MESITQQEPYVPTDFDGTEFKKKIWHMNDTEFYKAYDKAFQKIGFFDWTLTNFRFFQKWINGEFLEVGCGGGRTLTTVKKTCPVKRCVGVDISFYALKVARKTVPKKVEVYWADVEKKLPFPDKSFDTVLCGHTLEHLRHPKKAIEEIKRVCRDKTIILIPLQGEEQRWKKTNLHIQFWRDTASFEKLWSYKATEALVLREGTLAILLFKA